MPTATRTRVILVGHCGPDSGSISRAVEKAVPEADVQRINDWKTLEPLADDQSVLLVNRVLDGKFDSESGVDLIAELAKTDNPPVMLLVSNFDDAQNQARTAGAWPGFGKSQLGDPQTTDRLRQAVGVGD